MNRRQEESRVEQGSNSAETRRRKSPRSGVKTARFLIAAVALVAVCAATQATAQVTPQAVIGNAPSLPTPESWAANNGHTEAFKTKIAELQDALAKIQFAAIPTIDADQMAAAKAQQEHDIERQRAQQQRDMQQGMQEAAAMGFSQADLQRMGSMSEKELEAFIAQKMAASPETQAMKAMGFTDADLKKMQGMSEKQGEAYMKKRMAELGITEAEFRQRMAAAGAVMLSPEEETAQRRRDSETEAQGNAMQRAQETQQAYMEQMEVANGKIKEAATNAAARIEALWKSSKPAIDAAQARIAETGGPEEVMRGADPEIYNSAARRLQAAWEAYHAGAYRIWHEYILTAQGHMKFLLPYAQAADDAQRTQAQAMNAGNQTMAQLQGMSNYAITVAGNYLNITESEPKTEHQ